MESRPSKEHLTGVTASRAGPFKGIPAECDWSRGHSKASVLGTKEGIRGHGSRRIKHVKNGQIKYISKTNMHANRLNDRLGEL